MFPFFVHCSSFVPLPVRLAPSFVRHLFVICSFIVRLLFVFCSSFVRSLFVFCSFFVRSLFVLCSFFVRLFSICLCGLHRHLFVVPSSHFSVTTLPLLGRGLGRGYFLYLPVVLRLPVRLAPACVAHTFNSSFFTKLLPHTYQNTSQRFFSRQS